MSRTARYIATKFLQGWDIDDYSTDYTVQRIFETLDAAGFVIVPKITPMTETDNAEPCEIKRGEEYDVRVTVNAERASPASSNAWVEIPGCYGLVAAPHAALRRPAPRVPSEEYLRRALCEHDETRKGQCNCANGKYLNGVGWCPSIVSLARAVRSLFAGEGPSTLAPGCCSASVPCAHQKNDPTTICNVCLATRARGQPAPAEAQDVAKTQEPPKKGWCDKSWDERWDKPPQPTVTPDTAGARDFVAWLDGEKSTRPVAFRVEHPDGRLLLADGRWHIFGDESDAQRFANDHNRIYEGLYVRRGQPAPATLAADSEGLFAVSKAQRIIEDWIKPSWLGPGTDGNMVAACARRLVYALADAGVLNDPSYVDGRRGQPAPAEAQEPLPAGTPICRTCGKTPQDIGWCNECGYNRNYGEPSTVTPDTAGAVQRATLYVDALDAHMDEGGKYAENNVRDLIVMIRALASQVEKLTGELDMARSGERYWTAERNYCRAEWTRAEAELAKAREAAIEECAKIIEGKVYKERYRTWVIPGYTGNRSNDSDIVRHVDALADTLRALKAPQAGEVGE